MNYEKVLISIINNTSIFIDVDDQEGTINLITLTKLFRLQCPGNYILEWVNENKKLHLFDILDITAIKQTYKTVEEMVEWTLIYG